MDGRAFLDPARDAAGGPTESYWRAAVVSAYYALMLECRDALTHWGIPVPPRQNIHTFVRLKLVYSTDPELKKLGSTLDTLAQVRNRASYHLSPSTDFSSGARAHLAIQEVEDGLLILDAIEADPARKAAAIASLPP
jgi:hypothetical protein